ncbi:MAG: HipA domain-containing protein [Bacteroidales bacterium]|nr:HipA domain-containing protein [Bacteroidales bacterium]
MEKIYVFADFDWLKCPELIGELGFENIRGSESYNFSFADSWLKEHPDIFLSHDINNYSGVQYTMPGKNIFGCFSDALPDRWGRILINRREQILATEENRPARKLFSFDYLKSIDDFSRIGGFRFKTDLNGDYINASNELRIPPLSDIRELTAAANDIERTEEKNIAPERKWLRQLVNPGSSLGGARPKANVVDTDGKLYVAKFPSRNDSYDVELWEYFCNILGKNAGVNVANTRIIKVGDKHALLSRRFDRTNENQRIHFASAMTLLGLSDGDNASTGHGYLDIVDFITQNCCDVEANLAELFRRIAFSICVGNSDDHFRNHGFLLTAKGWTLSPAYDINPSDNEYQSLLINETSDIADLQILLDAHKSYLLNKETAESIINEVKQWMNRWRSVASYLQIPKSEWKRFENRFDRWT